MIIDPEQGKVFLTLVQIPVVPLIELVVGGSWV